MSKSALGRYIRQVNKLDVRRGKDIERQKKLKGNVKRKEKKLELTSEEVFFPRSAIIPANRGEIDM